MQKLLNYAKHVAKIVDNFILNKVLKGKPDYLYSASTHLLKAGGKRLRPTLLILSSRIVGGSEEKALPAAAAVELLHNFTLVHDDVMDMDEFRRGVPTVHKIWGISTAIIAGDLLFSKSFEALLYLKELGIDSKRIVEAARILAQAASTIAEGQAMDMAFEERTDVTEEEYFQMIYKKTAALFEASTKIGALVGGGRVEDVELLGNYGKNLGIAFQIQDDILGVIGEEEKLGKPVGSDIREGKKTIIVIHALRKASLKDKEKLLEALGNRSLSKEKINDVISLLISTGSIEYAKEIALKYANTAKNIIENMKVKDYEAKEMLIELANYVVKRLK